ncbi:MAG: methyltransferase domain-containing protein [bacterium]
MRIGEIVLRAFSKKPYKGDYNQDTEQELSHNELSLLRKEFPQFSTLVKGKRVVDFGCGRGRQSISLVREEGCYVCGIDTNINILQQAKKLGSEIGIQNSNLIFVEHPPSEMLRTFDIVISQNAMEHFPDPIAVLNEMKGLIHQDGKILITFGPPWFAPYGSHMHFFCKVPWLNLIFSERTVMNVRALYRNDGAKRYEEVESGLNKITVKKFERIVSQSGLIIQYKKYSYVKRLNWMKNLPLLRELFINHISCILTLPHNKLL